jgi:hypothetical protein
MIKVIIYMRSGNKIEFDCKEITVKRNGFGQIREIEIEWRGKRKKEIMYIDLNQIEGIIVNK